jgi:hypothetical protein
MQRDDAVPMLLGGREGMETNKRSTLLGYAWSQRSIQRACIALTPSLMGKAQIRKGGAPTGRALIAASWLLGNRDSNVIPRADQLGPSPWAASVPQGKKAGKLYVSVYKGRHLHRPSTVLADSLWRVQGVTAAYPEVDLTQGQPLGYRTKSPTVSGPGRASVPTTPTRL